MIFRCLILFAVLILLSNCQTQVCGSTYCARGYRCVNGRCIGQFFNTVRCPAAPCRVGFQCINQTCIANSVNVRYTPSQPAFFKSGTLDHSKVPYAAYFCDENIYQLSKLFATEKINPTSGYAVIMSNSIYSLYLRQQRLSRQPNNQYLFRWNYHVIFIAKNGRFTKVFDFDSRLPWGTSLQDYWSQALNTKPGEPAIKFRVVPYNKYLDNFASTRSGNYIRAPNGRLALKHPPPRTPLIVNKRGQTNTLLRFTNMVFDNNPEYGKVMSANEFIQFFTN